MVDDKQGEKVMHRIKIGSVVRVRSGRLGVVTKWTQVAGPKQFYGISFTGRPWTSTNPVWIADNTEEYVQTERAIAYNSAMQRV